MTFFVSGAPNYNITGQQTFTGGIYGPFTIASVGYIWLRLQFDPAASNTYQLSAYLSNPSSFSPPPLTTITGTLNDLTSGSGSASAPSVAYYYYYPNSNISPQIVFGGKLIILINNVAIFLL